MSHTDNHATSRAIEARSRLDARARRAQSGTVTELALTLLRDAREDGAGRRVRTRAASECAPRPGRVAPRRRSQPGAGTFAALGLAARDA
ncbi:MAG TPA: hypothetical protein VNV44_02050 [Solirubrobacteraceae bacterium]|jgi:hypothetical protein|nr:hypothetical protein [Solirubrobacteraceae bacterium]